MSMIDPNVIDADAPFGRNAKGVAMTRPPESYIVERVSPRVFYHSFDEENPMLVRFCYWLATTFRRDIDFRVEDAGWPMTPVGIRIVFEKEQHADEMVSRWSDFIQVVNCSENPPYTISDPDYHGYGW